MARRALLGAWLCQLAACSSKGPYDAGLSPPDICQPSGDLAILDEPELYLNQPVTVHLAARLAGCDGGLTVDVQTAITDPVDHPVQSTVQIRSQPYSDDDGGLALAFGSPFDGGTLVLADVSFQPTELGLHHLVARFRPLAGTFQADLISMVDGRAAERTVAVANPCFWFDVWNGNPLCVSVVGNVVYGVLTVTRNGVTVLERPVLNVASSDAGLWTVDSDGGLTLLAIDDDGGVRLLGNARLPQPLVSDPAIVEPRVAADRDQLLLVADSSVYLARPSADGGLEIVPVAKLPVSFTEETSAILLAGEGAAIGGLPGVTNGSTPNLCLVSFDGGVSCWNGPFVAAADRGVLWTIDAQTGTLSAATLSAGPVLSLQPAPFRQALTPILQGTEGLSNQAVFAFRSNGPSLGTSEGTLRSQSSRGVVRVPMLGPGPALEGFGRWPTGPDTFGGASPGCLWQYHQTTTGEVRYLER